MRLYSFGPAFLLFATGLSPAASAQEFGDPLSTGPLSALVRSSHVDPTNFLAEVHQLLNVDKTIDAAGLGKHAAIAALELEDMQIKFFQTLVCQSSVIPPQYTNEVQVGCSLLAAQADLLKIKRHALDLIASKLP